MENEDETPCVTSANGNSDHKFLLSQLQSVRIDFIITSATFIENGSKFLQRYDFLHLYIIYIINEQINN